MNPLLLFAARGGLLPGARTGPVPFVGWAIVVKPSSATIRTYSIVI